MISATQQGPRQFDTPVSFEKYQIPIKPPSAPTVKLRARSYDLKRLLEEGDYVCDVRKIVNKDNWEKLCEFHEIIKQNHNTFDDIPQKKEIDAALYHLKPDLYHWLIELKYKEESKVKNENLTKGFIYRLLSLDYSFAQQCARVANDPNSPFLSKFNWRNLTNISDVKNYNPSIKLQYEPLSKSDITTCREELEDSDSETSVSDTELGETETRALEAKRENITRKRKSRCSTSEPSYSASTSKKRKAQIIESDSDADPDADNALVKRGNGNGIETDPDNVTAIDTKNSVTTLNEKQSARQTSRPISPQVPEPVKLQNKVYDVVELDVDQLLEQPIDKKPSIVKPSADTSEPSASVKKWLAHKGGLNEPMELNEVNKYLWDSMLEQSKLVKAQADAIKLYQNYVKKYELHSQVPYFKKVGENEQLLKKYNFMLEQFVILCMKYQELRADHDELTAEDNEVCKALDINMQDLMAQVSKAKEDLEVYKKETIEAQEKIKRLELQTEVEKRQKLQKNYDELFKESQSAIEKSTQIEKAHSKLNAELKLAYNKWRKDLQIRKNAEQKNKELKLEVKQLTNHVQTIHAESYNKQVACNKAEKAFTQAETVLIKANEKAQAEILRLKEQNEKLQQRSETLENENSRLESELKRMRETFNPRLYNP